MKNRILSMLLLLVGVIAYSQPKELTESDKRKIEMLEQWCDSGDTDICEKLYFHYQLYGEKEMVNLLKTISRLSEQERPRYMFMSGVMLTQTSKGEKDEEEKFKEGMQLIYNAASKDYPPAQFLMGDYYSKSDSRKDINKAMFYINCAAYSDYPPAQKVIKDLNYNLYVVPDKEFRKKLWEAIDKSGDHYLEVGADKKEREELNKKTFYN